MVIARRHGPITVPPIVEAHWVLDRLITHFGIDVNLKWSHGRRRGIYFPDTNTISIGPFAWNGVIDTLLHEYAHTLANQLHIEDEFHGMVFRECLWRVIVFYHKDPSSYGWYNEFPELFEYGSNRVRSWQMLQQEI